MTATTVPAATGTARPAPLVGAPGSTGIEHWVVPLLVLIAGMFMSVLDTSIVNVAISTIQTELGGSTADVQWISTAYSLVLGVVVPLSGWLGNRFGLGRVYVVALAGFAVGSALCGLAWSLNSLIAFRVLQAIPGGLLPAVSLTMVYKLVPRAKIGTAMGMYGLGIIFAPAIGPALGGYLVEYVNWRLIFYINIPIGVVGLAAAIAALPRFHRDPVQKFDLWGFLSIAGGLVSLLLAFSEGSSWGWTSYRTLILICLGALLLAVFVVIELEVDHPLLDLRVFRSRAYTMSLIVMSVMMTGLFATLFYVPLFLQAGQGYPALDAGLLILPQAIVMAILTPLAGQLYDRFGPRWPAFIGLVIAAFGSYLLSGINPDMTRHEVIAWTCVRSFGVGMSMMAVMTGGISSLGPELTTSGSAINTVAQRVSAALGLAGLTALSTAQQAAMNAGRSELVTRSNPATHKLGLPQLYQVAVRTRLAVLADSYANVFLLTAATTLLAALLALSLRSGRSHHDPNEAPVLID